MEGFNKPTDNAEHTPDPLESLKEAKTQLEVNQAVKTFFPQEAVREIVRAYEDIYKQNKSIEWEEVLVKLQAEVKVELDKFTETILSTGTDRPEVILSAYNRLFGGAPGGVDYINPEDQVRYQELYKEHAVQAIKEKIAGGTDSDKLLSKCYSYDSDGLLSRATDEYQWVTEVEGLVK